MTLAPPIISGYVGVVVDVLTVLPITLMFNGVLANEKVTLIDAPLTLVVTKPALLLLMMVLFKNCV